MANEKTYLSLDDIRQQKQKIHDELKVEEQTIRNLWHGLFHPVPASASTPSRRIQNAISLSAGVLDGALLGWKLYRRFKRK